MAKRKVVLEVYACGEDRGPSTTLHLPDPRVRYAEAIRLSRVLPGRSRAEQAARMEEALQLRPGTITAEDIEAWEDPRGPEPQVGHWALVAFWLAGRYRPQIASCLSADVADMAI